MEFNEKLDFFMNMTKTTNSMLARYISLDASHISRLRTGSRKPAKNADYVRPMAAYFAKHCTDGQQLEVMMAAMNKTISPGSNNQKLEELIFDWLCTEEHDGTEPIREFLDNLSSFSLKRMPVTSVSQYSKAAAPNGCAAEVFYGQEGKREAVIAFFNLALQLETPCTLLISSEENMDWLTEKREFMVKWSQALQQLIMRGNKIKIIHHINRNLDEMLTAIREWLPIYMTGMVQPYFYPKTRDGVFQRTLFVAPGAAAVISSSVAGKTEGMANYLIRDIKAVDATAREINEYFALCKPLLHVYGSDNAEEYHKALALFEKSEAVTILKSDALSVLTLPADIAGDLSSDGTDPIMKGVLNNHKKRIKTFEEGLKKFQFHEIIRIPDISTLNEGTCRLAMSEFTECEGLTYTPDILKRQLENMIALLKKYNNYYVYIDNNRNDEKNRIYYKEYVGVMVVKDTTPSAVFAINESQITAAFWDYLNGRLGKAFGNEEYKLQMIERLESVVKSL